MGNDPPDEKPGRVKKSKEWKTDAAPKSDDPDRPRLDHTPGVQKKVFYNPQKTLDTLTVTD